jgi:hypothetical protein
MAASAKRLALAAMTVPLGAPEEPLARDLGRYKARARGARVRELALLGLAVEREGFRLGATGEIRWPSALALGPGVAAELPATKDDAPSPLGGLEASTRTRWNSW